MTNLAMMASKAMDCLTHNVFNACHTIADCLAMQYQNSEGCVHMHYTVHKVVLIRTYSLLQLLNTVKGVNSGTICQKRASRE